MAQPAGFKERWVHPSFFLGNNPVSWIGVGLTTASALTLIGFWVVDVVGHGGSVNPYVGIILDLCLPALFVLGLVLIPIGILIRRRSLRAAGQLPSEYPKVDLANPIFRSGLHFVIVATFINFVIVGTASYRGVAYMDKPSFCGQSCHVMAPEFTSYHAYPHANVACTDCHIASGLPGYVHAKLNGTKQLAHVLLGNYSRPIMAEGKVPVARATCLNCHNSSRYIGDKLVVTTSYGDDENNPVTRSVVLLHVGGRDMSGRLSGIHGAHMGHIEYIATDATITAGLEDFYRSRHSDVWNQKKPQIDQAAKTLSAIYKENVFPFMKSRGARIPITSGTTIIRDVFAAMTAATTRKQPRASMTTAPPAITC